MFQLELANSHFLMPCMKHYVKNKKVSENAELLIWIKKDDFNTTKPTGMMGAWYHCLFSDLGDFQRNWTERKL